MPRIGSRGSASARAFGFTGKTVVIPSAPVFSSGGPNLGNYANRPRVTLYATDPGTWISNSGTPTYTYQWYYGTTPISGATGTSLTLNGSYVGYVMKVRVTATNTVGSTYQDFLGPYGVLDTTPYPPTITSVTVASSTSITIAYTAPSDNGGATITQYMAQSSPGGITASVNTSASGTITVTGLTTGQAYTFQVYAYNQSGYSDPSASSSSITPSTPVPVNFVLPTITGTAQSGQTLTCSTGSWSNSPTSYAYVWQRGSADISGATSSSYTLTASDVGNTVRCVVFASNAGGTGLQVTTASTATVTAAPTGLYAFTTATFTPGGAYGQFGPTLTQARNGITAASGTSWTSNTSYLNTAGTQGGVILWTVPITGSYRIDAYGAEGGNDGTVPAAGFPGARSMGDFYLTSGTVLSLVVGQRGRNYNAGTDGAGTGWGGTTWGGGGGGGSFVWTTGSTSAPLLVAGGGGGGGASSGSNGGQTTTSGGTGGQSGAAGGTGGYSGAASVCGGGNGQGWFGGTTSGCGGSTVWSAVYNDPTGAAGASGGQAIGSGGAYAAGGFGGGNGAYGGSGGGGGYSGGGSGGYYPAGGGGGGGSYNAGSNQSMTAATRTGHGQIIITKL